MRWRCHYAADFPCASIGLKRKTHGEALRLNQEGTGEPQPYGRRIGVGGRSPISAKDLDFVPAETHCLPDRSHRRVGR